LRANLCAAVASLQRQELSEGRVLQPVRLA